jgi:hypothetical protein
MKMLGAGEMKQKGAVGMVFVLRRRHRRNDERAATLDI